MTVATSATRVCVSGSHWVLLEDAVPMAPRNLVSPRTPTYTAGTLIEGTRKSTVASRTDMTIVFCSITSTEQT